MNINYEGLVCYLNSNKDSKQNNVWLDSSGNNNNATLTSFSDDDFNGSYVQFNGNNYAVIPRCIQDDFTLSAEVILESSTSTTGPWQKWYNYASLIDAETSGVQNDFGLTISKDGHAYFGIGNPDWTIPYAQKSLFNEKHIITCTRKKDTGEYAMYIDGILIKKEIHPNKNSLTHPSEIYVGKGINNRFLSMKLFSIRIYNRVLDNFEIKQDSFFVKNKVYVNENNLPIIVDKLMDASNIKIANNKYGNRVQTVIDKIVEKADNVTKAINQEVINTDYSFKVGTGTNVDVSSDVQDGFSSIAIKGSTYQNLFNNPTEVMNGTYNSVSQEFVNTSDTWFRIAKTNILKPNTTYTLLFLYKSTVDKIRVRFDNDIEVNNGTTVIRDYGDILATNNFQQFKQTFTTFEKVDVSRLLIRNCYNGTVTIKYPVLLEWDHTNNPNLLAYFEGITGVGEIGKNLFDGQIERGYYNAQGIKRYGERAVRSVNFISVSPNTTYTISSNTSTFYYILYYDYQYNVISQISVNKTFTTPNNCMFIKFNTTNDSDIIDLSTNFQIEKGDTITSFEPYCFKINTISNGYNLLNLLSLNCNVKNYVTKHEITSNSISFSVGAENSNPWASVMFDGFKFKENTTYRIKAKCKTTDNTNSPFISLRQKDYNNSFMDMQFTNGILNITFLANNVGDRIEFFAGVNKGNKGGCQVEFWDICLTEELSNGDLPFQPYLKNTNSITIDSPLMRLPNGVCDEITKDGKLIRRIGKIILDGTERNLALNGTSSNHTQFVITNAITTAQKNNHANLICNTKPTLVKNEGNNSIWIYIGKTVVFQMQSGMTVDAFRQWLSQNPTTVYYELETPVITDIIPPSVRIYKDGHLTFNTLVAPESTHLVQLNKSAQINNTLEQVQSLNKKVDALDIIYNSLISSTSNTLSNLNK